MSYSPTSHVCCFDARKHLIKIFIERQLDDGYVPYYQGHPVDFGKARSMCQSDVLDVPIEEWNWIHKSEKN